MYFGINYWGDLSEKIGLELELETQCFLSCDHTSTNDE